MATDFSTLNRDLDRVKSQVFLGKNAAFFGSLLCSLEFQWSENVKTAATDGVTLWWNPKFFQETPAETNKTVLLHELEHVARLHMVRQGSRDPKVWNQACDIRINNGLENESFSFKSVEDCWKDQSFDMNGLMAEEDIYEELMKDNTTPPPSGSWGDPGGEGDMIANDSVSKQTVINNVVKAVQQAKIAGQAGSIPGGVEELLNKFLEPVVAWESLLMQFFTDMLHEDYTWKRPNRRHQDIYLPSRFTDDGRLEHLVYFLDVSGSISSADILRFNSEVKYIQESLKPQRLTLVQFDTMIQDVKEFTEDDPFDEINVIGRGGTCLVCVREYIEKHRPTAAVVFSDLYCTPMQPLTEEIPIIWAVIGSNLIGPFGKTIHIKN